MIYNNKRTKYGGSIYGHKVIRRMRQEGHNTPMHNNINPSPVFHERYFRRWFRMCTDLFHHIAKYVKQHDRFFV
jgi:hypothetical protein